ncbi:MAG: hypothetical protein ABEJ92_11295 [Halobacteriales archaeon]
MLVVQFPAETAPTAQAAARRLAAPVREEWQPDGTWTGLFDVDDETRDELLALVEAEGGDGARTREYDSEADIGGHRLALYAFD